MRPNGKPRQRDTPLILDRLTCRSFAALALPSGLMDRAAAWLSSTPAKWESAERLWRFPSGASLCFGYLDGSADRYRYNCSEYQYIGFDELTEFREPDYLFLFSRLRRLKDSPIPLRMRAAVCNWFSKVYRSDVLQIMGRVPDPEFEEIRQRVRAFHEQQLQEP
jgi:hypothetical protein